MIKMLGMLAWDWTRCGLVVFSWFACANSGENCYSCTSEQVSLKREYQKPS